MKVLLLALLLLLPIQAFAQDAVPVQAVETETLQPEDIQGQAVLELFSSQACVFCPKADQLLGDLSTMKNIIALACHVDYYDVKEGSLSRPFCAERQSKYAATLRSGPTYTPQMVVNGAYDVVGYRIEDISNIVRKASDPGPQKIDIRKIGEPSRYQINLPAIETPKIVDDKEPIESDTGTYTISVAFVDKPQKIKIAEGGNKGLEITYYNIVSDLFDISAWNGKKETMHVNLKTLPINQSFVVIAQKPGGEIVAVGEESLIPMPTKQAQIEKPEEDSIFDFFGFFDN